MWLNNYALLPLYCLYGEPGVIIVLAEPKRPQFPRPESMETFKN